MASKMICKPFKTIFSLGAPAPKGRSPLFPGLGINTLRAELNLYFPVLSSSAVLQNHSTEIPSNVSLVIPLLIFPGFPFINI